MDYLLWGLSFPLIFLGCTKENTEELQQFNETNLSSDIDGDNSNQPMRPFKGTVVYNFDPEASLTCDCAAPTEPGGPYVGSGNMTHMGNVYATNVPCFVVTAAIELPPGSGNYVPTQLYVPNQCGTISAANGDELYVNTAPYYLNIDASCYCTLDGTAESTIDGGTGRFSDATGSFTSALSQDLLTSVVTSVNNGTVDY